ncbi:MAG: hypothetical protein H6624_16865 [Bdellovibrionaceae bacterium]|nr:hypothetical protein [Pseudobdellovibrionaceae bacterium]
MSGTLKNNKEMNIPQALLLLFGVGLLVWFIYLPGDLVKKWNELTQYLEVKKLELLVAIGVIGLHISIFVGGVITLLGVGKLGGKIKGYYLSRKESKSYLIYFVTWMSVGVISFALLRSLKVFEPLLPFPSVVPNWQTDLFLQSTLMSGASLLGILGCVVVVQLSSLGAIKKTSSLPQIKSSKNTLVLGTTNEEL